jgi:hypothetical protein
MTRPVTSSKLILVEDRSAAAADRSAPVRRYRLARLQIEGRPTDSASRFDHLKRIYD